MEPLDPFALVADEILILANRLHSMVADEVPDLESAAEIFFKVGVEKKKLRPTVLLLMSSALKMPTSEPAVDGEANSFSKDLRRRQQSVVEITEMIHVASLVHESVLDDENYRGGVGLNFVIGNKLAVLAGDFLLARAISAAASLRNSEVLSLVSESLELLITGKTMKMTSPEQYSRLDSLEYYVHRTNCKTGSLMSNGCKSIAVITGQTTEVSNLAYNYGKNLSLAFQLIGDVLYFTGTSSFGKVALSDFQQGCVTAPVLFAMEEFPELTEVVTQGFDDPTNVNIALDYLWKSRGIDRTKKLAAEFAIRAVEAIDALPETEAEDVLVARRGLVNLTQWVLTRTK